MSVNGPISPKQCYHEIDYSFYSFYWLDSLEIRLDHNSTYYRSLSKNSDVKRRISHCDSQNLQYKTHPEFWPSHRRIFKTSLYYKTRLILETRRYITFALSHQNNVWAVDSDSSMANWIGFDCYSVSTQFCDGEKVKGTIYPMKYGHGFVVLCLFWSWLQAFMNACDLWSHILRFLSLALR